jgi:hypothetical protein
MKKIDLNKTVYELTEEYPELIDILVDLGFLGIANPIMRKTHGQTTTIPKGCEKHGKKLSEVVKRLEEKGFTVKYE